MTSTSSSGLSAPALANWIISPGPGRPARSGSVPEATAVVRYAPRPREPVYLTLLPVRSSHGLTMARNESCSEPPHEPTTVTSWPPATVEAPGPELAPVPDDPPGPDVPVGLLHAAMSIIAAAVTPTRLKNPL